jgi:hypothetical protein
MTRSEFQPRERASDLGACPRTPRRGTSLRLTHATVVQPIQGHRQRDPEGLARSRPKLPPHRYRQPARVMRVHPTARAIVLCLRPEPTKASTPWSMTGPHRGRDDAGEATSCGTETDTRAGHGGRERSARRSRRSGPPTWRAVAASRRIGRRGDRAPVFGGTLQFGSIRRPRGALG